MLPYPKYRKKEVNAKSSGPKKNYLELERLSNKLFERCL